MPKEATPAMFPTKTQEDNHDYFALRKELCRTRSAAV